MTPENSIFNIIAVSFNYTNNIITVVGHGLNNVKFIIDDPSVEIKVLKQEEGFAEIEVKPKSKVISSSFIIPVEVNNKIEDFIGPYRITCDQEKIITDNANLRLILTKLISSKDDYTQLKRILDKLDSLPEL